MLHAAGRYVDRLERRDGVWLLKDRLAIVDSNLLPGEFTELLWSSRARAGGAGASVSLPKPGSIAKTASCGAKPASPVIRPRLLGLSQQRRGSLRGTSGRCCRSHMQAMVSA